MPAPDTQPQPSGTDRTQTGVVFWIPMLGTVASLSVFAAINTSLGAWKEMAVMKEHVSTITKNFEIQQRSLDALRLQLQSHEIRLIRGKL